MSPSRPRRVMTVALVALVLLAAWLRLRGLAFGLPAVYNMDEAAILARALAFAKGDLNPHNFLYPTAYFYVLFAWLGATFVAGRAIGAIESLQAFQQSFFLDPTLIYLSGRALSVVCGLATVGATLLLARRAARQAGLDPDVPALAAAAFMAIAPFAVVDAHYIKHDVPVTLLVVLALNAVLRLDEAGDTGRPARSALVVASVLCGLAASTHYYAVFLALPLALAAAAGTRGAARRLATAGLVMVAAFFAGSPFLLAEPGTAIRDIAANRQIVMDRAVEGGGGAFASFGAYARMLATDAMGWPVALLAAVGAALLVRRQRRLALVLLSFPVVFVLFIGNTVAATRYLNPVLPVMATLAGLAVGTLAARVGNARRALALASGLIVVAGAPGLHASVLTGAFFRQVDTRTLALDWVRAHVPDGATILVQPYSVPLPVSRASLREALRAHLGDEDRASVKVRLQLALPTWPQPSYRVLWLGTGGLDQDKIYVDYPGAGDALGLENLRALGVQYVVLKSYNSLSPAAEPLVELLRRDAKRLATFAPYVAGVAPAATAVEPFLHNTDARLDDALERPGPVIEIWQLP